MQVSWWFPRRIWIRWMPLRNLCNSKLFSSNNHLANHRNGLCQTFINILFCYMMWPKEKSRSKNWWLSGSAQCSSSTAIYLFLSVEQNESKRQTERERESERCDRWSFSGRQDICLISGEKYVYRFRWSEDRLLTTKLESRSVYHFLEPYRFLLIWNSNMELAIAICYKSIQNELVRLL